MAHLLFSSAQKAGKQLQVNRGAAVLDRAIDLSLSLYLYIWPTDSHKQCLAFSFPPRRREVSSSRLIEVRRCLMVL